MSCSKTQRSDAGEVEPAAPRSRVKFIYVLLFLYLNFFLYIYVFFILILDIVCKIIKSVYSVSSVR